MAFMIALGQSTVSALVAAFSVWCLKVLERPDDELPKARVVVEGLIGAGKTTVVKELKGRGEPTDAWGPYLQWEARKNPGRLFCRQIRFLADYVTGSTAPKLEERSWASALMFTNLLLSPHDALYMESYLRMLKSAVKCQAVMLPNVVVYMNRTPEVCYERVQLRQQPGDDAVSLEYLRKLASAHETLMGFYKDLGVIVVDAENMTDAEVVDCCREHMSYAATDAYDPMDVIKAIDRWFGARSSVGL
jgi:thymidylate kinase